MTDPENDIAAISFSSGTTGIPKAMAISHYSYVSCLVTLRSVLNISLRRANVVARR
ncbi:unnamed protein product [Ixodes hexagonus]